MDPTAKTFRCVRCNPTDPDPALDPVAMAEEVTLPSGSTRSRWSAYVMTRDEALLRFRDGVGEPTWFNLRRLPAMWMCDVLDALFGASQQRLLAFRAAVVGIAAPGEPLVVAPPGGTGAFVAGPLDRGVSLAPPEFVEAVVERFGLETVQEIGRVAIDFSRLPKGSRGPFGLWHGSVASL